MWSTINIWIFLNIHLMWLVFALCLRKLHILCFPSREYAVKSLIRQCGCTDWFQSPLNANVSWSLVVPSSYTPISPSNPRQTPVYQRFPILSVIQNQTSGGQPSNAVSGWVMLFAVIFIACKHFISSIIYVLKNLAIHSFEMTKTFLYLGLSAGTHMIFVRTPFSRHFNSKQHYSLANAALELSTW